MGTPTSDWGPALPAHRSEAWNVHLSHGTEMGGTLNACQPDSYMNMTPVNGKCLPSIKGIALEDIQGDQVWAKNIEYKAQ